MAWSYIGLGTSAWGNNAAVSPLLPPASQEGDLLVCCAFIRENGATLSISSGWTLAVTGASSGTEHRLAIWYKYRGASETQPTVTPSGGGSGDVVFATIHAFRGHTVQTVYTAAPSNGSLNSINFSVSLAPDSAAANDLIVAVGAGDNDGSLSPAPRLRYKASALSPTYVSGIGEFSDQTATGSDGTFVSSAYITDFGASGTAYYVDAELTPNNAYAIAVVFRPAPAANTWTFTPSGGASAGGAATTSYAQAERVVGTATGDGGASIGGAATTESLRLGYIGTWTAEGGAAVGGAALTKLPKYGVQNRVAPTTASLCGLGDVTVSVPASSLVVDDLLVLHLTLTELGSAFPILPSGWELLYVIGDADLYCWVIWKRWQAGDSETSVTISFTNDTANSGKRVVLSSLYNVDWSYNDGAPFGSVAEQQYGTAIAATLASKAPILADESSTLWFISNRNAVVANQSAESLADGWVEAYDLTHACTYGGGTHLYRKYTPGQRGSSVAEGYTLTTLASAENTARFSVAVASLGQGYSFPYVASGGAIVSGAATTIPPATPSVYAWMADGGPIAGALALVSFRPAPVPTPSWGVSFSWPAAASRVSPSGWYVEASVSGSPLRLRMISLRRDIRAAPVMALYALSLERPCVAGASVSLRIMRRTARGEIVAGRSWSILVDRVRELDPGYWLVEGVETGVRSGGASRSAGIVLGRSSSGLRCAADFDIVPGDTVDGYFVASALTSIAADGSWFTEVFYGQS